MAKIFKTARKLHKTAREKYIDGCKKLKTELRKRRWKPTEIITPKETKHLLKLWLQSGNRQKDFYRLGPTHLKQMLKLKGVKI